MTSARPRRFRNVARSLPALALLAFGCSSREMSAAPAQTHDFTAIDASTDAGGPVYSREPVLPAAPADCPILQTGTVSVLGKDVEMWVGEKQADTKGPVLFYWHGTGQVAQEIQVFMQPMLDEIQKEGGIAASFTSTLGTGTTTGNNVWFTGDYVSADVILACAVQQLNIDVHRIYAAGCSAGGLQAGSMVVARSSYLAAAMPNSGGDILVNEWDDPTHVPALITTHGSFAADLVYVHFSDVSRSEDQTMANRGGYTADCDHGGGHCRAPKEAIAAQWQFVKDHPFGVVTDPYADGLPSSFPSYCTQFAAQRDK